MAQAVGPSTAQPTGTVDARGRHTTWYFEYGESTFYGAKTPTKSGGSAFGAKAVTASISGLRPEHDVSLPRRGDERRRDEPRRGRHLHDRRRHDRCDDARPPSTGSPVLLSGLVPVKKPGEVVTVYAQEYGQGSPRLIATVATNAVGAWSFAVKPSVMTSYQASWLTGVSQPTVVGVRPAISLKRVAATRFSTRVVAAHWFARRTVKVQRETKVGTWVTPKRSARHAFGGGVPPYAPARHFAAPHRDEREPGRGRLPRRLQPDDRRRAAVVTDSVPPALSGLAEIPRTSDAARRHSGDIYTVRRSWFASSGLRSPTRSPRRRTIRAGSPIFPTTGARPRSYRTTTVSASTFA